MGMHTPLSPCEMPLLESAIVVQLLENAPDDKEEPCWCVLCKHTDPNASLVTSIFYRAVSPSCNGSWCLQCKELQFSWITVCPCFHPLTSLRREPHWLLLHVLFFPPFSVCSDTQPASLHWSTPCALYLLCLAEAAFFSRLDSLFCVWVLLCFFSSCLGKHWLIVLQSLETINLVHPDNLCSHTNRGIVLCVWEERFSCLTCHCFLKWQNGNWIRITFPRRE